MFTQITRYALVGGLGTSVHYCLLLALVFTGAMPILATAIGATCGAVINFFFCKGWVFSCTEPRIIRSAYRFLVIAILGVVLNTSLFALIFSVTGIVSAQLISTFAVFLFGYWMNSLWTFPRTAMQHRPIS